MATYVYKGHAISDGDERRPWRRTLGQENGRSSNDIAPIYFADVGCGDNIRWQWPVFAGSRQRTPIQMFDTDNDGTLDLAEVKRAASALFARLDRDHDGTLDKRELAGRLSPKEFDAADQDHDGTLTLTSTSLSSSSASMRQIRTRVRHLGCQGIKHQRRAGTLEITRRGRQQLETPPPIADSRGPLCSRQRGHSAQRGQDILRT